MPMLQIITMKRARPPSTRVFRAASVFVAALLAACSATPESAPSAAAITPWSGPSDGERAAFESLGLSLQTLELPPAPAAWVATVPAGDYQPILVPDDSGRLQLGWTPPQASDDEALAHLVVAHQAPLDLRFSLAFATWFARMGFEVTVVDLRGYAPLHADAPLRDAGEGAALSAVLDLYPRAWALQGYPTALAGLAFGGASSIYAAAEDPRFEAVFAAMPIPDLQDDRRDGLGGMTGGAPLLLGGAADYRLQSRAWLALDAQPIVTAARAVRGCTLLLQTRLDDDPDTPRLRDPARSGTELLRRALPRAVVVEVDAPDLLGALEALPVWGDAAALWLVDALLTVPGDDCPAFEPVAESAPP